MRNLIWRDGRPSIHGCQTGLQSAPPNYASQSHVNLCAASRLHLDHQRRLVPEKVYLEPLEPSIPILASFLICWRFAHLKLPQQRRQDQTHLGFGKIVTNTVSRPCGKWLENPCGRKDALVPDVLQTSSKPRLTARIVTCKFLWSIGQPPLRNEFLGPCKM